MNFFFFFFFCLSSFNFEDEKVEKYIVCAVIIVVFDIFSQKFDKFIANCINYKLYNLSTPSVTD